MALPQKGSRRITVKNVCCRWRIRSKPTYGEGAYATGFSIAVERADPPSGCVLLLAADFPRPDNWLRHPYKPVTPRMVAASIGEALAHGWRPEARGSAFHYPLRTAPGD